MKQSIFNLLKNVQIEREVEDIYNKKLQTYFPDVEITHPYACDGLINTKLENNKPMKVLIEYKYDMNFTSPLDRARVIIQVLYYLKRFENEGQILPNICMVGDKNECFVFHTNEVINYLDEDVDWSIAPSAAYAKNPDFLLKIASEKKVNPYIFRVDEEFQFKEVVDKIKDLADNIKRLIHITEHNIDRVYTAFLETVIKNAKKYKSNKLVGIFIGVLKDHENYYKHPGKKNSLVTPDGIVDIRGDEFDSFFSYFQKSYSPREINKLTSIADRLIEDTERRNRGDFWTPTLYVDYAHKMIKNQFGEGWKEKYVVWDCACGGKNLTRDYKFKNLYCSTLFESELDIAKDYNKEATSFQFDFLNDSDEKLPKNLLEHFKNNDPIMFFINPPYGTACNKTTGKNKAGIADTRIRLEMKKDNVGAGAENLQHQFLYRICKIIDNYHLTNVNIALFSKPIYLSGAKQKGFLKFFCNHFKYENGIMFCAGEFSNVSSSWGITFNLWQSGQTQDIHNFNHTLVKRNKDNEIEKIGEKNIYNVWNKKLMSEWVREPLKDIKAQLLDKPCVSSAIIVKELNTRGKTLEGALGYFNSSGNSIQFNSAHVGIYSSTFTNANGVSILPQNFTRCAMAFSARKLIDGSWITDKDEYLTPDEGHKDFKQFELDSVVYSLFNTSSNQSSLRNVEYKGGQWDIKNEFFFMSKEELEELANDNSNQDCYNDVHTDSDRFVYNFLEEHYDELSDDAKEVLNKARELVKKSFKYRVLFNEEEPKYQINNWDCGWYQIKALLKSYLPDELKEFRKLYKEFANRLRPMVYELGFLKK